MFTSKTLSGSAKAGVNLVEDQQSAMLVANLAQTGQKLRRRNVDSTPHLYRLKQHSSNLFPLQQFRNCVCRFANLGGLSRVGEEATKVSQLLLERSAEMLSMGCGKCSVSQAMIAALKGNHARLSGREHRRLQRRLDRLETRITKNGLP